MRLTIQLNSVFLLVKLLVNLKKMNISSPSSSSLPENVIAAAREATYSLLPVKSKEKYQKAYKNFEKWANENGCLEINETVLMAFFQGKSQEWKSPSTLWSNWSMIRTMMKIEKNVDIVQFARLTAFLKQKNVGYKPKKAKVLTKADIERYLKEAPDGTSLLNKVDRSLKIEY